MMNFQQFSLRKVYVAVLASTLAFASCTDLEEEVFTDLTPDNFPTTAAQVDAQLAGVYSKMFSLGSHNSFTSVQEISTDEVLIPFRTKSDWEDGGQWLNIHKHIQNGSEQGIANAWIDMYTGVAQTNSFLRSLKGTIQANGVVDEATRTAYVAETRALRAYYYANLLDMFGGVPIITDEGEFNPAPGASSRADVYNFVVSELTEVSPDLSRATGVDMYARMNYWAAQSLLARVYLNAEVYSGTAQWGEAAAAAGRVIAGPFSLTSSYHENFNADNDNGGASTSELIMVVPYDPVSGGGFNIQQMTLHYSSQATFDMQEQPWNGYCSLQEFYESYDDDDTRKGVSGNQQIRGNFLAGPQFAADGVTPILDGSYTAEATAATEGQVDPDGEAVVFTPEINQLEPYALRQAGVRVSKYEIPLGVGSNNPTDWPVFRLGDVMLIRAEALFRDPAGDNGQALTLLNQVRTRSYPSSPFSEITLDNLLAERGREMFYEGTRRQDLIRFGKFNDAWEFKSPSEATKNVMPIPVSQLNVNSSLEQNPGY